MGAAAGGAFNVRVAESRSALGGEATRFASAGVEPGMPRGTVNALAVLVNVLGECHRAPRWFLAAVRSRAMRNWSGVDEALMAARAG